MKMLKFPFFTTNNEFTQLEKKNEIIKKTKKKLEQRLEEEIQAKNILTEKYIALLEEKADGFNKYLHYHDLYAESYALNKEYKKEIAELKSKIKMLESEITEEEC